MRLYSTPRSALAGEVSVLAIVETAAATAFSVWLVLHRGALTHVVIGACVAPFLLLRTDESTELAMSWGEQLLKFGVEKMDRDRLQDTVAMILMVLAFPLIRPLSLFFAAFRWPLLSIRAIPQNWIRMVLATDLSHPPEILPEIESKYSARMAGAPAVRFTQTLVYVRKQLFPADKKTEWRGITASIAILSIATFWYVPALAYRYSLKATAVIYIPILWVLHDSLVEASSFQHKLEDIKESQIERLKRWYSGFVVLFLVLAPAIVYLTLNNWCHQFTSWLQNAHPAAIALLSVFLPTTPSGMDIRGWHLARGINATITIVLLFWADGKLRQIARGSFQKTDAAVAGLNLWLLIRGLLTLYIIGCTLYIVTVAVSWKDLWPVHIRWFP